MRGVDPAEDVPAFPRGSISRAAVLLSDLMAGPRPPATSSLVGDGLIPENTIGVLYGAGGVGKTWETLAMALAVATGRELHGMPTQQARVVVASAELCRREMWDRFAALEQHWLSTSEDSNALKKQLQDARERVAILTKDQMPYGIDLADPTCREELIDLCTSHSAKLAIFDPFALLHTAKENSNDEMKLIMRGVWEIQTRAKTTLLLVHHPRKGSVDGRSGGFDDMRGAGVIGAHARVVLRMTARHGKICLACQKINHGRLPAPIWLEQHESGVLASTSAPKKKQAISEERAEAVVQFVVESDRERTTAEIREAVPEVEGLGDRTIRKYLLAEAQAENPRIKAVGKTSSTRWRKAE